MSISSIKVKEIENKISDMLRKYHLEAKISLQNVKDIIWNSRISDNNIIVGKFMELVNFTNDDEITEMLDALMLAWNNFPHKELDGLSPSKMATGKKGNKSHSIKFTESNASSMTVTKLFKDSYPAKLTFEKHDKNNWGFELPAIYFDLIPEIDAIEEDEKITAIQYQKKMLKILKKVPYHAYATGCLVEFYLYNKDMQMAKDCYEICLAYYLSIIPQEFDGFIPWAYMNNREFLRLLHGYGSLLLQSSDNYAAVMIFEQLLKFNPNDNQGIREILMNIFVSTLQTDKALQLAKVFPDDDLAGMILGQVLCLYYINKRDKAKRIIIKHRERLANIFTEIFKSKHTKPKAIDPDFVSYMGPDEAYYYWCDQGFLWDKLQGAKVWLNDILHEI